MLGKNKSLCQHSMIFLLTSCFSVVRQQLYSSRTLSFFIYLYLGWCGNWDTQTFVFNAFWNKVSFKIHVLGLPLHLLASLENCSARMPYLEFVCQTSFSFGFQITSKILFRYVLVQHFNFKFFTLMNERLSEVN